MILLQFMTAFPTAPFAAPIPGADLWDIGRLLCPLQPGMTEWMEAHNVQALPSRGYGYTLRWLSNPDSQRKMIATVMVHADSSIEEVERAIEGRYANPGSYPEIAGDRKKLQAFQVACTEAGLL